MSFSTYVDVVHTGTLDTMYLHTSAFDYSWGCYHSGYSITSTLVSPSNRTATSSTGGMYGFAALAINDEFGTYSGFLGGLFDCSCLGYQTSYGDQNAAPVRYPADVSNVPGEEQFTIWARGNYLRRRVYQVKDQTTANWEYAGGPVHEMFISESDLNAPESYGCNITVETDTATTNNQGRFQDKYGNINGSQIIAMCAQQDCRSSFYQRYTISNRQLPQFLVQYECLTVKVFK